MHCLPVFWTTPTWKLIWIPEFGFRICRFCKRYTQLTRVGGLLGNWQSQCICKYLQYDILFTHFSSVRYLDEFYMPYLSCFLRFSPAQPFPFSQEKGQQGRWAPQFCGNFCCSPCWCGERSLWLLQTSFLCVRMILCFWACLLPWEKWERNCRELSWLVSLATAFLGGLGWQRYCLLVVKDMETEPKPSKPNSGRYIIPA